MKKSISVVTAAAMVGLFLIETPLSVRAVDGTWTSTSEGDYTNLANWAGSQMPDATGKATFNANASYQVDWSASVANGAANFAAPGGQVTLNIGSVNAWTLTNSLTVGTNAGSLAKALVSSGTLSVTNIAGNAVTTIGSTSGTGVLAQTGGQINLNILTNGVGGTITNSGGVMKISSNMAYLGSLYIMNGGVLSNTSPQITVMYGSTTVVSGANSTLYFANSPWNNTGSKPGNNWLISNGGQLVAANGFGMTTGNGSSGADTMLITDPGTLVTIGAGGAMQVGAYNAATVIVTNKAGLIANSGTGFNTICLGNNSGSGQLLLVTGTGSYVRVTGNKNVTIANGSSSSRIEIRNGATWTNTQANNLYLSQNGGSNNKMLITDPGTIFYSSGAAGVAGCNNVATNDSITVSNSATATFATDITIGSYTSPYANYVEALNGASLAVRNFQLGGAYNGYQSSNNWLRISNATFTASGTMDVHGGKLMVQQNGSAKITGLLTLTNAAQSVALISGGAVTNGGMVVGSGALVNVIGTSHLQVNGAFTNSAGASTVQFIGTPSAVGRIDVTGTWTNSATAKLTVDLSQYTWPSGSSVTLATFGSMPVQYAAGNITVSNKSVTVKQTASAIIAIKSSGTAVFFR